ncbi:type 1 fimbrial protein [Stenotrophomonas maltophilia]|nr:type 1 fimbrial protein [Stenotrophomonas maltophilia]
MTLAGEVAAVCYAADPVHTFVLPHARLATNAADVGDAISPWLASPSGRLFSCGSMGSYRHLLSHDGLLAEIDTYREQGREYGVFETDAQGIGVVYEIVLTLDKDSWERRIIPVRAGPLVHQADIGEGVGVHQVIRARYIKIGPVTVPDSYSVPGRSVTSMSHFQLNLTTPRFVQDQQVPATTFDVVHIPLCHVQAKTVNMGFAPLAYFARPGDVGPVQKYSVDLICDAGAGKVNYYVEPATTAVHDRERAILEVEGGARGIGLQLLDNDDNPVPIGDIRPFGSSAADGRRTEVFGARYIRTAVNNADLGVGQANTSVRYRIDYP